MLDSKWLLIAIIPFITCTAWAGDVSHGSLPALKHGEFRVLGAQWGTGHRWADVTEKACELATEAGLDVAASRTHFGDPYPHFKKALVVFYLWRGELRSATAHENGRLRIPVRDEKAAAIAVVRAAEARVSRIAQAFEAGRQAASELLDKSVSSGSIDAIRKAVRKGRKLAKALSRRLTPQFEELDSFFARHPTFAADPGLVEMKKLAAQVKIDFVEWEGHSRTALEGMREVTTKVSATYDWWNLGIEAEAGSLIAFEAKGSWKLGGYAGSCDATGLSGDRYAGVSTVSEFPHGCLLVRVGSNLFAAGKLAGATRATESGVRVEATCNDNNYRDNSGAITIRVLVVPWLDDGGR